MLLEFGRCRLLSAWRRKKLTNGFVTLTWRGVTSPQCREDALPSARNVKLEKGFFQRKQVGSRQTPVLSLCLSSPWDGCGAVEGCGSPFAKGFAREGAPCCPRPSQRLKLKVSREHWCRVGSSTPGAQVPLTAAAAPLCACRDRAFLWILPCFAKPTQGVV